MSKTFTVRLDEKGRLVLPQEVRRALGAKTGDVFYLRLEQGGICLAKGENPFDGLVEEALGEIRQGRIVSLDEWARRESLASKE